MPRYLTPQITVRFSLAFLCITLCGHAVLAQDTATEKAKPASAKSTQPKTLASKAGKTAAASDSIQDKPAAELSPEEKAKAAREKLMRKMARRRGEFIFDDLKFDIEKDDEFKRKMLPKEIESYNKRTIRIRGYMFPTFQQEGIQDFVLVRDNLECCFGPGAAIFDCIRVKMSKGKTAKYSIRPIAVKGVFEIEEFRMPNGYLAAIYKLTATEVK